MEIVFSGRQNRKAQEYTGREQEYTGIHQSLFMQEPCSRSRTESARIRTLGRTDTERGKRQGAISRGVILVGRVVLIVGFLPRAGLFRGQRRAGRTAPNRLEPAPTTIT